MRSRFRREMHNLFEKSSISLEAGILNDLIYRLAGIEKTDNSKSDRSDTGLNVTEHFNYRYRQDSEKDEVLTFTLPKMPWPQVKKLLAFFNIREEDYIANKELKLDDSHVENVLLPALKKAFSELTEQEVIQYQVKSRPILESSAVNTINENVQKALNLLFNNATSQTLLQVSELMKILCFLQSQVNSLRSNPALYKTIDVPAATFQVPKDVAECLQLVNEGVQLFQRYNRYESVLAIRAFRSEVETFLNKEKISAANCDVVEETILQLAGASLGKQGKSKFETGHDQSRIVLHFTDIDQANTDKVVQFLQNRGDKTAAEGRGYQQHGSSLPKAMLCAASVAECASDDISLQSYRELSGGRVDAVRLEQHSIEFDGLFLYNTLFPAIQTAVQEMKATRPEAFAVYQEKSVRTLEMKSRATPKETKPNPMVLFQLGRPAVAPAPVVEADVAARLTA